jgi:hypothetical protein
MDDAKVVIGGDASGAVAALEQTAAAARANVAAIKGHFDQLAAVANQVKTAFVAITAAFAGGKLFGDAIADTQKLSDELRSLRVVLGISSDGAAGLREALAEIGVSSETYLGIVQRMTMHLRTHEERFKQLGIETRNANKELLDTREVMQNTLETLLQYKEGTDRNLAATETMGRGWVEASKLLRLTRDATDVATRSAVELGLAMGPQQEEQAFRFKKAQAEVKAVLEGMAKGVWEVVMPSLIEMGTWFRSIGPEAIAATKAAVTTFKVVMDGLIMTVRLLWTWFKGLVEVLTVVGASLWDFMDRLIHLDLSGAHAAAARGAEQMRDTFKKTFDETVRIANETADDIRRAMDPESALPTVAPTARGTKKWTADTTAQDKKDAADRRAIAAQEIRARMDDAKAGEKQTKDFLKEEEDDWIIRAKDRIALERETSESVYQYQLGLMNELAALYKEDSKEYARVLREMEKLNTDHNTAMRLNAREAAKEHAKVWNEMAASIQRNFETAMKGVLMGTQSLKQGLGQIWNSILLGFADMGVKMVAEWAKVELTNTIASVTGAEERTAAEAAAGDASMFQMAANAIKAIVAGAAQTFAGVFAFLSPEMGPAAAGPAAASEAVVLGVQGLVSAAGGYDVPAGANPMAILHPREMVLPAHLADVVRSGGGGAGFNPTIHIHAIDSQDMARALQKDGVLGKAIAELRRNFHPSTSGI